MQSIHFRDVASERALNFCQLRERGSMLLLQSGELGLGLDKRRLLLLTERAKRVDLGEKGGIFFINSSDSRFPVARECGIVSL